MSFYIEKVIVSGSKKRDSVIELRKGTNIIYGPSNTGKSCIVKCIDYMFGAERSPFDVLTGYEEVRLVVNSFEGIITMNRRIGENTIHVYSTDNRIRTGNYKVKANRINYEKTINSVWLTLIGIKEMHLINSNENYKKQILSWRTFFHMFFLSETKIISEQSIFLSGRDASNTAVISSLLFLLNGQDFAEFETVDSKDVKEAKKDAVKAYINKELFRLTERNQELLKQLSENSDFDIVKEIDEMIIEIAEQEKQIRKSLESNRNILSELHKKNENLAECNVLLNRYSELTTQYSADLNRLSFIVDGEVNLIEPISSQCPFCDGKLVVEKSKSYINAAKADFQKIKYQARDLEKAEKELLLERNSLEEEINFLMKKKEMTEELVEMQLKPQLSMLKERLAEYKTIIEYKKEMDILKKLCEQKNADILENELEVIESKFKVKEHIEYDFVSELSKAVKSFLEACKVDNLLSVSFSKSDMDIVINGKKKSSNGKGYNAYFNSVVAIVLSRYMKNRAHYAPNFLVLDSPILSLKENGIKKPSETMRYKLFENIVNKDNVMQTIIVENEIPDIEYKDTNLIHFTKKIDNGRYGFLLDVVD